MAATAAALSTYIQTVEPAQRLIELTTYGTSGTTLETTVLAAFCQKAINWFGARGTTYDPDNFLLHQDIAHYLAMQLLYSRTENLTKASEYEKNYLELLPGILRRRTVQPSTNSPFTQVDEGTNRSGQTIYSPFAYPNFDGYRAGNSGATSNPGTWPPD